MMQNALAWLGAAVATGWLVARQSVLSVRQNWGIAILSVVLAISLWTYVTGRNDTQETGRIAGSVPVECVNAPAGKAEAGPCRDASVTLRVRAPKSVFDGLTADNFKATADLSELTGDQGTVSVRVQPNKSRVDILEISSATINARLENVTSRTVEVRVHLVGTPPRGFEAREVTLSPKEAVVAGPDSLVKQVAAVEADLDLTAARTDFEQTLLLKPRDGQGADIRGVNIEPNSATVQAKVAQLQFSAVFVVEPEISGAAAAGFSASGVQVDPPFVVISGSAEVFQSLDPSHGVATEPVSIDGASADVVRTVALRLPQGASVDQPGVTVRITIARSQTPSP